MTGSAFDRFASVDHALTTGWRVVDPPDQIDGRTPEDTSIYTVDGKEVLGCSEWIRCDREVFDHIVALHNTSLQNSVLCDKPPAETRKAGNNGQTPQGAKP